MGELENWVDALNTISKFVGRRDVSELTKDALRKTFGIEQVDVMILFGGTIPAGYDVAATAYLDGVAKHLLVVGGIGHTTAKVWSSVSEKCPDIKTVGRAEAEIIREYLEKQYGLQTVLTETKSTNCGNNISYALEVLKQANIPFKSVLLLQDLTMQRRMNATLLKQLEKQSDIKIINFATYEQQLRISDGELSYVFENLWGMWEIEHYISLLLGEVARLRDDEAGYGPNGLNYMVHEDIPEDVERAYEAVIQTRVARMAHARYK